MHIKCFRVIPTCWSACDGYVRAVASNKVAFSRHYNLLMSIGFLTALQAVRKLIKQGLLWVGMPCSSWIWMSRGTSRRCALRPRGSKKMRFVRSSNRLVRRVCYLFLDFIYIYIYMMLWSLEHMRGHEVRQVHAALFSHDIFLQFYLRSKAGIRIQEESFLVHRATLFQLAPILQTIGGRSYQNFLEIQCMMMQSLH